MFGRRVSQCANHDEARATLAAKIAALTEEELEQVLELYAALLVAESTPQPPDT